jgi:hypothetical protein
MDVILLDYACFGVFLCASATRLFCADAVAPIALLSVFASPLRVMALFGLRRWFPPGARLLGFDRRRFQRALLSTVCSESKYRLSSIVSLGVISIPALSGKEDIQPDRKKWLHYLKNQVMMLSNRRNRSRIRSNFLPAGYSWMAFRQTVVERKPNLRGYYRDTCGRTKTVWGNWSHPCR